MKAVVFLTLLTICSSGFPAVDPYIIENKVQLDLENALSRVIPREKFFVQVASEMTVQAERKLVEGETITQGPPEVDNEEEPTPMPGFSPEVPALKPKRSEQNRETYRLVETPQLAVVRVHIGLDENIRDDLSEKIRFLVQSYLSGSYPNRATVIFTRVPMLKPLPSLPPTSETNVELERTLDKLRAITNKRNYDDTDRDRPRREPSANEGGTEGLNRILPWVALTFACLSMLFLAYILRPKMRGDGVNIAMSPPLPLGRPLKNGKKNSGRKSAPFEEEDTGEEEEAGPSEFSSSALLRSRKKEEDEYLSRFSANSPGSLSGLREASKDGGDRLWIEGKDEFLEGVRNRFLDSILSRSDTFKLFFERLDEEEKGEIAAGLKGPAFESFMEGMGMEVPPEPIAEPAELEKKIEGHYRKFREFSRSKEWQDKQFFGFLGRLNEEQLMTLVHHESPLAVCAMLRFLKPSQSAALLDSLSPEKRGEIMGQVNLLRVTSFSELAGIERKVRETVTRIPNHFFGSPKGDLAYWGAVLSEAQDQDSILSEVERTNPGIYPHLKKFKFKLDDLGNVPQPILKKILSETDNEELSLALLTLPGAVADIVFGVMPPQRKGFLVEQMNSSRGAAKERIMEARLTLTKRFREELA